MLLLPQESLVNNDEIVGLKQKYAVVRPVSFAKLMVKKFIHKSPYQYGQASKRLRDIVALTLLILFGLYTWIFFVVSTLLILFGLLYLHCLWFPMLCQHNTLLV